MRLLRHVCIISCQILPPDSCVSDKSSSIFSAREPNVLLRKFPSRRRSEGNRKFIASPWHMLNQLGRQMFNNFGGKFSCVGFPSIIESALHYDDSWCFADGWNKCSGNVSYEVYQAWMQFISHQYELWHAWKDFITSQRWKISIWGRLNAVLVKGKSHWGIKLKWKYDSLNIS